MSLAVLCSARNKRISKQSTPVRGGARRWDRSGITGKPQSQELGCCSPSARIEETWRLWQKFLDDYSRFEDWLQSAERTAACPNSSEVLYTNAKEELKRFEVSTWPGPAHLLITGPAVAREWL